MAPARTSTRHVHSPITRWIWLIVLALFVHAQLAAGCGSDPDTWEPEPPDTTLQHELEAFAEWGLENLLPPPLPPEQIEIEAVIQHRRQVAATMDDRMAEALVPVAIAVAMFVPDGPVDVLLSVVPVHKLGHAAAKAARNGLEIRHARKQAKKLQKLATPPQGADGGQAGLESVRKAAEADRTAFEAAVNALGWKVYEIPESDLLEADKLIDNVQVLKGIRSLEELE